MTTNFTSLPVIDVSALRKPNPTQGELDCIAVQLHMAFRDVGFAYLKDIPLSFEHRDVFRAARELFSLPTQEKMKVAKKTFRSKNPNTYRGYFPAQQGSDNLKEGFELGPPDTPSRSAAAKSTFNLREPNVFPSALPPPFRATAERLHRELQSFSQTLLSLLASSLSLPASTFTSLLAPHSVSTLRLLHYPATPSRRPPQPTTSPHPSAPQSSPSTNSATTTQLRRRSSDFQHEASTIDTSTLKDLDDDDDPAYRGQEFTCTPHTDSGLLTLLHQDPVGGLEVLNAGGRWIPAPYVPNTIVVNIGDLLARLSGGTFVATVHRVRNAGGDEGVERYSVPFFCEPDPDAVLGYEGGRVLKYEGWVLGKMAGWVEFQDAGEEKDKKREKRKERHGGMGAKGVPVAVRS